MKNIATAARRCHVLASGILRQRAAQHGWATVDFAPSDLPYCAVLLQLGMQRIPVHLVLPDLASDALLLEAVTGGAMSRDYLEQVIVLLDCPSADVRRYRALFDTVRVGCITVGTVDDYCAWLSRRLGPVAKLGHGSPLRLLSEGLLEFNLVEQPSEKRPPAPIPEKTKITRSFKIGRDGVQCFETAVAHALGAATVQNMESDAKAQEEGYDLLLRGLKTEVKTEDYSSGNICLETFSCFKPKEGHTIKKQTIGWLLKSTAAILGSLLWPTGDLLLSEFPKVRAWAQHRRPPVPLKTGSVAEQHYESQFYLANINELLVEVPESLHLKLGDWMPTLYGPTFKKPSLVKDDASAKTLPPPRLLGLS